MDEANELGIMSEIRTKINENLDVYDNPEELVRCGHALSRGSLEEVLESGGVKAEFLVYNSNQGLLEKLETETRKIVNLINKYPIVKDNLLKSLYSKWANYKPSLPIPKIDWDTGKLVARKPRTGKRKVEIPFFAEALENPTRELLFNIDYLVKVRKILPQGWKKSQRNIDYLIDNGMSLEDATEFENIFTSSWEDLWYKIRNVGRSQPLVEIDKFPESGKPEEYKHTNGRRPILIEFLIPRKAIQLGLDRFNVDERRVLEVPVENFTAIYAGDIIREKRGGETYELPRFDSTKKLVEEKGLNIPVKRYEPIIQYK